MNAAIAFYADKLGFEPAFTWGDPPTFSGMNLGDVQIFLDVGAGRGSTVNFVVDDADALFAFHRANGVHIVNPIEDREYGLRDYTVKDPDGNRLSFGHYIYSAGAPVVIERADFPLRIEKRLAALMHDLAAFKRMSVSSLMEEILLHTSEKYGDGVASPHTAAQLDHIQELKLKHGIDYDTHASYRFEER